MPARRVGLKWASDNRRLVMDPLFPFKGRTPTNSAVGYETLIHDVVTRRYSCAPTWWSRPGGSCSQCLTPGRPKRQAWPNYDSGGDGPAAADELLARDGERIWRPVTTSLEQTS